jgi:hypothetical protein
MCSPASWAHSNQDCSCSRGGISPLYTHAGNSGYFHDDSPATDADLVASGTESTSAPHFIFLAMQAAQKSDR